MNPTSSELSDVKFEIGHVLFIDIVGYSKLLIDGQREQIQKLKEIVRGSELLLRALEPWLYAGRDRADPGRDPRV